MSARAPARASRADAHRGGSLRACRTLAPALAMLVLALALPPATAAGSLEALLERHGKAALVQVLMRARSGQISVRRPGGEIVDTWGRPRLELVDAATLARDLREAGLGVDDLERALAEHGAAQQAREQRLSASVPRADAIVPLANIDPKHRIRPAGQRRWSIRQLMEDARRERPDWPGELDRLRQQQAAIRNRRIEDILVSWTQRYGTMDENEIARQLRDRLREPARQCRALRRDRDAYRLRGCEQVLREAGRNPTPELREQLAVPFREFEARMRPAMQAHAGERRALSLY